ncbi:MAG: Flp family type IVb pilin [Terriglobales bacterium]
MQEMIRKMWRDDDGQDLIEYALIVGLVSIIAVVAITAAGVSINTIWTNVSGALSGAA